MPPSRLEFIKLALSLSLSLSCTLFLSVSAARSILAGGNGSRACGKNESRNGNYTTLLLIISDHYVVVCSVTIKATGFYFTSPLERACHLLSYIFAARKSSG